PDTVAEDQVMPERRPQARIVGESGDDEIVLARWRAVERAAHDAEERAHALHDPLAYFFGVERLRDQASEVSEMLGGPPSPLALLVQPSVLERDGGLRREAAEHPAVISGEMRRLRAEPEDADDAQHLVAEYQRRAHGTCLAAGDVVGVGQRRGRVVVDEEALAALRSGADEPLSQQRLGVGVAVPRPGRGHEATAADEMDDGVTGEEAAGALDDEAKQAVTIE